MDASATGVLQSAYLGQPTQLRPAAPIQLANGQFYQPLVFDQGAGMARAPYWNRPVESWVRAPQGPPMGVPPNATAVGWEAGFIPKPGKRSHQPDNPEQTSWTSQLSHRSHVRRRRQLLQWDEDLVKC